MNLTQELWMGRFLKHSFSFEDREAIHVFPQSGCETNRWLLKTEYFDAFPSLELSLVEQGCHLLYLKNTSRWGAPEDLDAKKHFRDFLICEFGLSPKCIPIGMSAGGASAILLAARYPEMIGALYLDAPVVNFLSCPFGFGVGTAVEPIAKEEVLAAYHMSLSDFIAFREHPLDKIPSLLQARLPVALVCGSADMSVPFEENGRYIRNAYESSDIPFLLEIKSGCGHHPHGPSNIARTTDFLLQYAYTNERKFR